MSRPILIRGAEVVPMTPGREGATARVVDVLAAEGRIAGLGAEMAAPDEAERIDGRGLLVLPGLINAHLHSDENLFRGCFDNLPLEPWMMWSLPLFDYGPLPERLIYLRTMVGALEMARLGTTTVVDDLSESPRITEAGYAAAMQAYAELGLRARVSANAGDRPELDKVPYLRELLPRAWAARLAQITPMSAGELLALNRRLVARWQGAEQGRLGVALSCSAPQRCTPELLRGLAQLSSETGLPLHFHVLETRVQVVTGRRFYGSSILRYAADLGMLSERASVIHGVWLDGQDIATVAEHGASVVHNPVSNLKLASGIAPLRALREAGVGVALGTDGASSNDAQDVWEVIKLAALLHKITDPDPTRWPSAEEALRLCLEGGARSAGLAGEIGAIRVGARADLALYDRRTPTLLPTGDPLNLLVYADRGRSLRHLLVDGAWVLRDGRVRTVDEAALLAELAAALGDFRERARPAWAAAAELAPSYQEVYRRCAAEPIGFSRWATDAGTVTATSIPSAGAGSGARE